MSSYFCGYTFQRERKCQNFWENFMLFNFTNTTTRYNYLYFLVFANNCIVQVLWNYFEFIKKFAESVFFCFDLARAIFLILRLYLELNGGHESHQNLWMTYEDGNFTGWHSLETITILYISFLVRFFYPVKRRLKCLKEINTKRLGICGAHDITHKCNYFGCNCQRQGKGRYLILNTKIIFRV